MADPPNAARLDEDVCRLRGYAWGENIGWINLDDEDLDGNDSFVEVNAPGDIDGDGMIGSTDLLAVLAAWGPYDPCPPVRIEDIDAACLVGVEDLLAVLSNWGPMPVCLE